ncbi:alcohol dehydrogenase [Xylariomycetidae sp. FL0641]|nr:alcohol dehydrogenase [Xylariomycetidae sp. FL0641]
MSKVKSWIYTKAGYPETLQLEETEVPSAPGPHHLLVQTKAAALNPVDIQLMNVFLNSLPGLNKPKIAGRDFAGVVLAAGSETSGFSKGDEVMGVTMAMDGSGTLTEAAHLDLRSTCVIKKPSHFTWTQAASLPLVWLTAYTSVEKCAPFLRKPAADENRVAVLGGSSATGMFTVWLARRRGWTVLASCSGRNAEFVKKRGAHEVVDYTTAPDAVRRAAERFKPDAIIDCVGGTECIGLAPRYVTIVGDKTSRATMGGPVLYYVFPRMYLRWLAGYLGLGNSYECIILQQEKEWLEQARELQDSDVVIDSKFGFEQAKEAFERLNTGRARGKVVVELSGH